MTKNILILLFLFSFLPQMGAQPVECSKQTILGHPIYRDLLKPNRYYITPSKLRLAYEANNPQLRLLEMRYTGTACYDDSGERHFSNHLQLIVEMEEIPKKTLALVEAALGDKADLRPLPIRNLESWLLVPVSSAEEMNYQKIGESASQAGENDKKGLFWRERTFTLRLSNQEAGLLWDQIENGKLAVSFGYAFYADMVFCDQVTAQLEGDSALVEDFAEIILSSTDWFVNDTVIATQTVRADAFGIDIDPKDHPEVLQRIDINEKMPPGYAALELRCFDFKDQLRPDLFLKRIELEAVGVSGRKVKMTHTFKHDKPSENTHYLKFPYGILMDKPLRYQVTSYTRSGEKSVSDWEERELCEGLIDITTPVEDNPIATRTLDVELSTDLPDSLAVVAVDFVVYYHFDQKELHQKISFLPNDELPFQSLKIRYDKAKVLEYEVVWHFEDGKNRVGERSILEGEYFYLGL